MKIALLLSCAALAYNPETCPVVLVKGQDGNPLRINKDDYDANPDAWELISDEATAPVPAPAPTAPEPTPAPAPAPVQMVVTKIGRGDSAKFFATDTAKNKIEGVAGIDADGYDTEAAAWAAIMAVASNG